ncbi:TraR/DksA family transcriptional regulator [Pseudodesulfovibrio sp. JC047]|uniref:TraR/DksA family transcriptional regulator n=1 Tax=Pseudodesulfovibrio sp. JC047 TaxID=2683199 RepID=UPI0013CFB08A|nr:TraR/DksA family transcriptional regulator [Pseudodesulfovibrio sp. JC047]NDV20311.1 TraR/DksA family transcriptional regulator [Pseudodesulfovibrio sp. JC047]
MTGTQKREIRKYLIHGLEMVVGADMEHGLTVENCPDDMDFASQLARHGMSVTMQRRRVARIREMEAALRRLSETDYGMCEECGDPIGMARLMAHPSARLCVTCQANAENGLSRCA